ncbi:MAG TPA: neutral zinc metallopeptidase [Pyrinomonadaceae bacterium]|nr:neutral zinc metallopeptidase [Pyrinomonadaceae bacterium]
MKWRGRRESTNVEDRRGMGGRGLAVGGGIGTLLLAFVAYLFGADPSQLLNQVQQEPGAGPAAQRPVNPEEEELRRFVGVVLAETEDAWEEIFRGLGRQYRKPTLVVFDGQVDSACGVAGASVGPFYCPGDERLYIDLSFYRQLRSEFRAPGDFAQAYVLAHEVGHHVQHLLGTMEQVHALQQRSGQAQANQLSVRLELQADCYAGVWAHHAGRRGIVETGDVEEALGAASAVGDDRLQQRAQGYVVPDSFTHGTAAQRASWFRHGLQAGDARQCDTFRTQNP